MEARLYPWCSNSRRWLTVLFVLHLPQTCPFRARKDCVDRKCGYYEERPATAHLLRIIEAFEGVGCGVIVPCDSARRREHL